jgi:hypothetical protein
MMHINTPDIIARIGVVEQRQISEIPFFESCSSVSLWILMFFHTLVSHYYSIVERRGERKGSWDADTVLFLSHGTNEKYLFLFI